MLDCIPLGHRGVTSFIRSFLARWLGGSGYETKFQEQWKNQEGVWSNYLCLGPVLWRNAMIAPTPELATTKFSGVMHHAQWGSRGGA